MVSAMFVCCVEIRLYITINYEYIDVSKTYHIFITQTYYTTLPVISF